MTRHDFTPFFRTTVGFDRMMNLLDSAAGWEDAIHTYPPYNIEKADEDSYRITLAVAGFGTDDLTVEQRENTLVVTGRKAAQDADGEYLYRGIGAASFQRSFQLADYVTVEAASLDKGLLRIDLHRDVPEALKPRRIEIRRDSDKLLSKAKKRVAETKKAA
jgi:molecular chaperone IbpA